MRAHGILMVLLVCLMVINSTEIVKTEKSYSYKDIPGMIMTKIKSFMSTFKKTTDKLNNTPRTKHICVWKICSFQRPINKQKSETKKMENKLMNKEKQLQEWLKEYSMILRKN